MASLSHHVFYAKLAWTERWGNGSRMSVSATRSGGRRKRCSTETEDVGKHADAGKHKLMMNDV